MEVRWAEAHPQGWWKHMLSLLPRPCIAVVTACGSDVCSHQTKVLENYTKYTLHHTKEGDRDSDGDGDGDRETCIR